MRNLNALNLLKTRFLASLRNEWPERLWHENELRHSLGGRNLGLSGCRIPW